MKIEYAILWIDDEMDSVKDDQEFISEFLEEHGIATTIDSVQSAGDGEIHNQVRDIVTNPELDLIVVDYLMEGMNGQELIELIRSSDHVFLPVIFYSSVGSSELAKQVAEAQLDGVYLAHRDRVKEKIQLVVSSLIQKEQTSKNTRGLLMEGVSEIDALLGQLLNKIWGRLPGDQRQVLISYFRQKVSERSTSSSRALDQFPEDEAGFARLVLGQFVSVRYDMATRWKIIKKGLAVADVSSELRKTFDELFEPPESRPLIRLRNEYAHKTRSELELHHDASLCVQIRRELRRQSENMKEIDSRLS